MNPQNDPATPTNSPLLIPLTDAGVRHQPLLAGPPQTRMLHSGQVSLAVGDSVHTHSTEEGEELLLPLAGRGQLTVPGMDPLTLEPGSVLYIPPHTHHKVSNTGSEPLVYVYVYAAAPVAGDQAG